MATDIYVFLLADLNGSTNVNMYIIIFISFSSIFIFIYIYIYVHRPRCLQAQSACLIEYQILQASEEEGDRRSFSLEASKSPDARFVVPRVPPFGKPNHVAH